jgi:hypothetical protein
MVPCPARLIVFSSFCSRTVQVLDATKNEIQRALLEKELETCGIRINTHPPNITFRKTSGGGVKFNSTVPLTKCDESVVKTICQECVPYSRSVH